MFPLQVVFDGELVIPTPAWVSYAPQAQIVGRRVAFLHTSTEHHWALAPEQLEEHCARSPAQPRILILNYPSNPTGGTFTGIRLGWGVPSSHASMRTRPGSISSTPRSASSASSSTAPETRLGAH
jgi:histidinol-phosphate/aromatic aminotransferase/cobyric acid decarboxylase-like protein